ncbi:MAG TPA: UDP-N-acetylmuramoyl-tripeptide--D-alanyl-D-alanine ligase [Candidatus Eisenbacteria bacterium]|nr:UDP-N-acetylmuramoyl-tripeptide--D-alanyl-D-alanine ligase [Candidatus Eisenbacteria bacterium]
MLLRPKATSRKAANVYSMGPRVDEVVAYTRGTLVSGPPAQPLTHLYTDSRDVTPGGLFVALKGEALDGHAFMGQAVERGAAAVLCELAPAAAPASVSIVRVPDSRRALVDLTRGIVDAHPVPVVGITGSAGKTTTKEMVAHVLGRRLRLRKSEGNLNTYTGIPMTVFDLEAADRALVLEYAMSRPGEIHELTSMAPPSIAAVLNVGIAHVGYLGSIEAVAAAKRELVEGLRPDGLAVLNADDDNVLKMAAIARRSRTFGFSKQAEVRADQVRLHGLDGSTFRLKTPQGDADVFLRVPGQHLISNALATAAIALEFDFDPRAIASALRSFQTGVHRMSLLSGRGGARLIDDTYNASPGSMRAALSVLRTAPSGAVRVAVLGDMLELGDHADQAHDELGRMAAQSTDHLFVLGAYANRVVAAARGAGMTPERASAVSGVDVALTRLEPLLSTDTVVLIKGSRGMRLERLVEALEQP